MPIHPASQRIKTLAGLRFGARSLIAQAVAILSRYGGSLWVADPAYTFTGSDGTGAASDGSDTGYVRDLCGNTRPLLQSTTSFKPKLRRVPKRLGPELVTNGDFASATGWNVGAGWSISSGVLSASSPATYSGTFQVGRPVRAGKRYRLGINCSTFTSGSFRLRVLQNGINTFSSTFTAAGYYTLDYIAPEDGTADFYVQALLGGSLVASFDDCTFREVLEWGWAWVFDGVDDILATPSLPAGTDETIMVCATSLTNAGTARAPIGKRNLNNGLFLRRESGGALNGNAMTGSGFGTVTLQAAHTNFQPFVATVAAKTGASRGRFNGSQVATTAGVYAGWAGPLGVGAEKGTDSGTQWNGNVFAAAYIPGSPPDAELLIIERAMGQLAGVTI